MHQKRTRKKGIGEAGETQRRRTSASMSGRSNPPARALRAELEDLVTTGAKASVEAARARASRAEFLICIVYNPLVLISYCVMARESLLLSNIADCFRCGSVVFRTHRKSRQPTGGMYCCYELIGIRTRQWVSFCLTQRIETS